MIYEWTPTKGKGLSVNYEILPTGVDIEREGLSFTSVTEILDYD